MLVGGATYSIVANLQNLMDIRRGLFRVFRDGVLSSMEQREDWVDKAKGFSRFSGPNAQSSGLSSGIS